MAATTYSKNLVMNFLLRGTGTAPTTWYVALFSEDPGPDPAVELPGTSYARVAVTFVASLAGTVRNSANVTFPTAGDDWGTATHYGVFDALTSGNLLVYETLDDPNIIIEDDVVVFEAGFIEVTLE